MGMSPPARVVLQSVRIRDWARQSRGPNQEGHGMLTGGLSQVFAGPLEISVSTEVCSKGKPGAGKVFGSSSRVRRPPALFLGALCSGRESQGRACVCVSLSLSLCARERGCVALRRDFSAWAAAVWVTCQRGGGGGQGWRREGCTSRCMNLGCPWIPKR
jgi:hypothetical protein